MLASPGKFPLSPLRALCRLVDEGTQRATSRAPRRSRSNSSDSHVGIADVEHQERKGQDDSRGHGKSREADQSERTSDRSPVQVDDSPFGPRNGVVSRSPGKRGRGEFSETKQYDGEMTGSRGVIQTSRSSQSLAESPRGSQNESFERARGGKSFAGGPGKAAGSDSRITFKPRAARGDGALREGEDQKDQDLDSGRR